MKRITGVLQHYPWGRRRAIAELRGVEPSGHPEAEYWLGTHARGPSRVLPAADSHGADGPTLASVVAADPARWLGPSVQDRFGEVPFLLKILAAAEPLSIQAHPNAEQARAGFDRENLAGLDPDDFKRSYRDPNHKPELICAISRFEAKCGFRDLRRTRELLSFFADPALRPLQERLNVEAEPSLVLRDLVRWLVHLDRPEATGLVEAVVSDAAKLLAAGDPSAIADVRPELDWTVRINEAHPGDIGVVVALLLNHLSLQPGESLFLKAGEIHAYLTGVAVEIMANSDNVLRCGLTSKHIDVDELMVIASFTPGQPSIEALTGSVHRFDPPVPEFALTCYSFTDTGRPWSCDVDGPEIVVTESGSASLRPTASVPGAPLRVGAGEAVAVPAATARYELELHSPETRVWRATVGR